MSSPANSPPTGLGQTDVRDAFFNEVYLAAEADRRVMVLSDDQGAFSLQKLRRNCPDQYINLGIAEQNAIDLAAGMARGGLRPIVYGITNFVSLRCAEQISVSLSQMALPVTIVASGGGLTYASDGPTHHGTQDIAVLRTMPGMAIYNPADAAATAAAARLCLSARGPTYVRLEKGVLPALYSADHDFTTGCSLLRQGGDLLIVATGFITHVALQLADRLRSRGVAAAVLDLFRLKPAASSELLAQLRAARAVVIVEEQGPTGGVYTLIAELMVAAQISKPVKHFSLPDQPCFRYGSREWLQHEFSLSSEAMQAELTTFLSTCARSA